MWCANCQADVAAEASLDNRRIRCASCGRELNVAPSSALVDEKTREARQLLQRWSQDTFADPPAARPASGRDAERRTSISMHGSSGGDVDQAFEPGGLTPKFRVDTAHPAASPNAVFSTDAHAQSVERATVPAGFQNHDAHQPPPGRPHFDVQAVIGPSPQKSNSASLVGQLMAYLGVAVLTIGTALVLWGYFGGPPKYTPTGWLIATAGQMLLFLGVVTLVSGGMEQTSEDVARRIDSIGERILRIEQASRQHALQGPHRAPAQFADGSPLPHKRQVVEQQAGD